jgi:uncharacterized RDD family membrane protein YckC
MVKASFIRRFAALVADGFILGVISTVIGAIIGFVFGTIGADEGFITLLSFVVGLACGWFYYVEVPVMNNGQTLGKKLFHIRIVKETGELTRTTMFVREYIGKFCSGIIFLIGYLMALGDSRKALHDRFVDTIVVKVDV